MKKKRRQHVEQPARPDGWYWLRYHIPLRRGHYHYEWVPVRIEYARVQLWGSRCTIPLSAPILENAMWQGPVEPPPLDEPPRTALALRQGGNRQNRNNRRQDEEGFTDEERHAIAMRTTAADIAELLFEAGKEVREGKIRLAELVDRVEELLDDAFGGGSEEP